MSNRGMRLRRQSQRARVAQPAYRQIVNRYKPMEVLDDEQIEQIHCASLDLLETVGMKVLGDEARSRYRSIGAQVDQGEMRVRIDRALVLELIAKAPASFTLRGRNPLKKVRAGDGHTVFVSVGGPAYVSDLDRGRRPGTYDDFCQLSEGDPAAQHHTC